MIWCLNKNEKLRDEIIFGKYEPEKYVGGGRRFEGLSLDDLKALESWEFIDLDERHNACPSVKDIMQFMEKYPDYSACGYVISVKRDDYRVSLDGVEKLSVGYKTEEEYNDFCELFKEADEFSASKKSMSCWFD